MALLDALAEAWETAGFGIDAATFDGERVVGASKATTPYKGSR